MQQLVEGAQAAGCRLREFDEEHAVVHRATEGAKKAWFGFKQVMTSFMARACASHRPLLALASLINVLRNVSRLWYILTPYP